MYITQQKGLNNHHLKALHIAVMSLSLKVTFPSSLPFVHENTSHKELGLWRERVQQRLTHPLGFVGPDNVLSHYGTVVWRKKIQPWMIVIK